MAVLKRLFHGPEQGSGEESRYYLARDTESGQVFVLHELSLRQAEWSGGTPSTSS